MSVVLLTSVGDGPMITPPASLPDSAEVDDSPFTSLLQLTEPSGVAASADSAVSGEPAAPSAVPSASPSAAGNATEESNTGTCHGPPGMKGNTWFAAGRWPGVLADGEVSCNSVFNNVTRACCVEPAVGGEARLGSECGLWVCKVTNATEAALTACFEKHEAKSGCTRPETKPDTTASRAAEPAPSSGAARVVAGLGLSLLAGAVALGVSI